MGNTKKKSKPQLELHKKPRYPELLKSKNSRKVLAVLSCFITILLVYMIVSFNTNGLLKFLASVLVLGINGALLTYLLNLEGESGLIIIKLKEGNKVIEKLTNKFGKFWNTLADIGLVLGFGLSSKLAFKHISKKTFVLGLFIFLIFVLVILPNSGSITFSLIQIPLESIQTASKAILVSLVAFGCLLLFGVVGFAIFGILANAINIISSIIMYLAGNTSALATSSPGVYPVLPYFTIPFFEGLIALLVLMVVHEGSHGIAATLSKIRIKSTGIITFGFIPVGAFVDIDEKQLDEKRNIDNARVSVAGSTANLLVALLFFIPTALLMLSLPNFQQPILIVTGTLKNISYIGAPIQIGTTISSVNGIAVNSTLQYLKVVDNITANSTMILMTDKGESTTPIIEGMPGFVVAQPFKPEFGFIRPIFATLGLITILNLLVGIVNLLPIPSFDGHRLFKIIFNKNKFVVNLITAAIVFAFLMNIVPWIWQ